MPIPQYVPKSKHKEYRRKHKKIVKAIKEGKIDVDSPYAVATAALSHKYRKKR